LCPQIITTITTHGVALFIVRHSFSDGESSAVASSAKEDFIIRHSFSEGELSTVVSSAKEVLYACHAISGKISKIIHRPPKLF